MKARRATVVYPRSEDLLRTESDDPAPHDKANADPNILWCDRDLMRFIIFSIYSRSRARKRRTVSFFTFSHRNRVFDFQIGIHEYQLFVRDAREAEPAAKNIAALCIENSLRALIL